MPNRKNHLAGVDGAHATYVHNPEEEASDAEESGALLLSRRDRIAVRDVTALLKVSVKVDGFQFDSSIMEHPEFLLSTVVDFQCVQHGGKQLQARWRVYRTFQEFQGLDAQLRQAFPQEMQQQHLKQPPRLHRRRTFFRLHRSKKFLQKRCVELNEYLTRLLRSPCMRLTRFLDPRAPLVLRCFCNFDAGFMAADVSIRRNQFDSCVLCLESRSERGSDSSPFKKMYRADTSLTAATSEGSAMMALDEDDGDFDEWDMDENEERASADNQEEWQRRQDQRQRRRVRADRTRQRPDSKLDELQANLLDDKARNMAMCLKYECACQVSPFRVTHNKMSRMLRLRGFSQTYAPPEGGLTALYCVLFHLQQFNDLDKRLYDALTGFPAAATTSAMKSQTEVATTSEVSDAQANAQLQLSVGVELLRQTLANYGLLHVYPLERHFRTSAVDLKKKLHEFKSRRQLRVGALELVLLATMLDLSIQLISNDHEGSEQRILPLAGLRPIRLGGRISMTLGYILPTLHCVNGFYLLAESENPATTQDDDGAEPRDLPVRQRRRMWLGVDEMDRRFMADIERTLNEDNQDDLDFDFDVADTLNAAILDAVWDDCQHNPNMFNLFQRQARQFGKGRTSARFFVQYLEVAFGLEGATYLVDFLLHVLPEKELRKQLLHARWMRLYRHLSKRVSA